MADEASYHPEENSKVQKRPESKPIKKPSTKLVPSARSRALKAMDRKSSTSLENDALNAVQALDEKSSGMCDDPSSFSA